jgi:hypothetical protein
MVHCRVLVHSDQLYVSQLKVWDPELHESNHKRHLQAQKAAITISNGQKFRKAKCYLLES